MPSYTFTAYNWSTTGYNATYTTSHQAVITDDDGAYEGSGDAGETVSVDGGASQGTFSSPYSIDVAFTATDGSAHVETFRFFYSDAWYFIPEPGSAFGEGATLGSYQSHTNGWNYADVVCFADGTMIETARGPVAVEALRPGDAICLAGGRTLPLRLNLCRRLGPLEQRVERLAPVRIAAGALGVRTPRADLWVSRQHRMLVSSKICGRMFGAPEVLIPAIRLTGLPGIAVDRTRQVASYHHLIFECHAVVIANGAPAESFLPGPAALAALTTQARAEFEALFAASPGRLPNWTPARPIPKPGQQKRLVDRHRRNAKPLLSA